MIGLNNDDILVVLNHEKVGKEEIFMVMLDYTVVVTESRC